MELAKNQTMEGLFEKNDEELRVTAEAAVNLFLVSTMAVGNRFGALKEQMNMVVALRTNYNTLTDMVVAYVKDLEPKLREEGIEKFADGDYRPVLAQFLTIAIRSFL